MRRASSPARLESLICATSVSVYDVQSRLGGGRVAQYVTDGALALLERQLLKFKNVDILIGKSLANLSKRSRSVFQANYCLRFSTDCM